MTTPEHVAIIMDGNGRWASARGLPRAAGHRAGAKAARAVVENARKNGVKTLTLFAFSSENWHRPRAEVRLLLDLFRRTILREIKALHDNGVRLRFIGERGHFSNALLAEMDKAESRTRDNQTLNLVIAVDYGGRWDIVQASRALATACARGELDPDAIDERQFARRLSLHCLSQPDLFIRTGGERRISNFLLWDLAYSELYFTDRLWPDFDADSFRDAIQWFGQRERRFGRLPAAARQPGLTGPPSMLAIRIATALVVMPLVVLGIVFLPTSAVALIFAVVMLMGAWEWAGLLRFDARGRWIFVAYVVVVMLLLATVRSLNFVIGAENLVIGLACLWWVAAIYWIVRFPHGWHNSLGRRDVGLVVGIIALVAPVAAVTYAHQSDDGAPLVLAFFFLVWAADTGAYFAGRMFGRHKLAPRVSPGKTREGALGGVLASVILAALCAWLLGYDTARSLAFMLLGGWIALISIVGDLTISMFKRHAQIKDSGTLFPGHGGVLDRLDSVLAAAPWFVAGLHWLPAQF